MLVGTWPLGGFPVAPVNEGPGTPGIAPRPVITTVRDTVGWLREAGHLSGQRAGR
jgi:hypothetical protein